MPFTTDAVGHFSDTAKEVREAPEGTGFEVNRNLSIGFNIQRATVNCCFGCWYL